MTLEEFMEGVGPKEGMRYWRDGMYVLADALRSQGYRIAKLERSTRSEPGYDVFVVTEELT